jgi:hypothetical protein
MGNYIFVHHLISGPLWVGNFVSTLDGVVSYKIKGHAGGSTISGSDPGDRFIMGLLRASADAVMVGARTVHDVSPEVWPDHLKVAPSTCTPAPFLTRFANSREKPEFILYASNCFQELRTGLRIAQRIRQGSKRKDTSV